MIDYEVVVPPELSEKWAALPVHDHDRLAERLRRAAQVAGADEVAWPEGPAGAHRGKHRAIIDGLWVLFQLNDEARRLEVIGFGQVAPH